LFHNFMFCMKLHKASCYFPLSLVPCHSFAEVPHLINYQGKLADADGASITGTKSITFRIYNVSSGGVPLWQETQSVTADKGIFNVLLGAVTDLNLAFDEPYYLAIKVESDAEMSPRQRITSSGYALNAKNAENAIEAQHAADANTVTGLTPDQIGPVANFKQGSYIGDGTSNRIINVGFTPDYVFVMSGGGSSDGMHRFYGMGSSYWQEGYDYYRDRNDSCWKGIVSGGFKSGSEANNDRNANKNGRLFNYIAIKQQN